MLQCTLGLIKKISFAEEKNPVIISHVFVFNLKPTSIWQYSLLHVHNIWRLSPQQSGIRVLHLPELSLVRLVTAHVVVRYSKFEFMVPRFFQYCGTLRL